MPGPGAYGNKKPKYEQVTLKKNAFKKSALEALRKKHKKAALAK